MKRLAHQGLQKVIKKCYKAVNVINGFTLHPMFSQVCGNSGNQIIVRHYFEGKVAGWLCTAGSTLGFDIWACRSPHFRGRLRNSGINWSKKAQIWDYVIYSFLVDPINPHYCESRGEMSWLNSQLDIVWEELKELCIEFINAFGGLPFSLCSPAFMKLRERLY